MHLQHRDVNFEDDRGTITDIFVREPKEHATIIFSKKGAVRGNHLHKISKQHDFIVSGALETYMQKPGEPVEKIVLKPYDFASWEEGEAHEFIALEDTVFITFVDGLRGGEDYEKDTYRLDRPLHEIYEEQQA